MQETSHPMGLADFLQRLKNPKRRFSGLENVRHSPSLGAAWQNRVHSCPNQTICLEPSGKTFLPVSAQTLHEEVTANARAMVGYGLETGDRLALMAPNGRFWAAMDLAAQTLGVILVPLFQGQYSVEVKYILQDSEPKLVCVQGKQALGEIATILEEVPYSPPIAVAGTEPDRAIPAVMPWQEFLRQGEQVPVNEPAERNRSLDRSHLATLVYTSGTTGWPKGVELTHGNLLSNIEGILQVLKLFPGDRFLSFLPLAHIFERTTGHFLPYLGGAEIAYAQSPQTVPADMQRARPTVLVAVPRMYQLFYDRIQSQRERDPLVNRLLSWATGDGGSPTPLLGGPSRRLLRRGFRNKLGGSMRLLVSGGAALPEEVAQFFWYIGLPILEGYGQTETAPVVSVNPENAVRIGTVGQPLPNVMVRIADEGEILVQGPNVMRGYWRRPEETASVLEGGWLHTGDGGHLDAEGYLQITDRLKEILVTSGGKNISPQRIEVRLTAQPIIQEAVVFGHGQPFLAALILPDWEALAHRLGWETTTPNPDSPAAQRLVRETIHQALADMPAWEQIRRFRLLAHPFRLEKGELTPTRKVKRKVVAQHYADTLEALFAGSDHPTGEKG